MEYLKHYIACDHRINRKRYIMIWIAYFALSMLSGLILFSHIDPGQTNAMATLVQQKTNHFISEEDYRQKMNDLQQGMMKDMPVISYAIGFALAFIFIPAIAMRLKDVDYPPMLALFFLVMPLISIVMRLTGSIAANGWLSLVSMACLVIQIILAFVPGTRGANRYGPDPLDRV